MYLEIFYDPELKNWDAVADEALEQIDFTPTVILLFPLEDSDQTNDEPERTD
jgi:hypothetical protein